MKKKFIRKKPPTRNYNDPAYKAFRQKVLARDSNRCQFPGCRSTKRLNVHHIRTWAEYPSLRFEVRNGITLCSKCHGKMWSKENQFIVMLTRIAINNETNPPKQRCRSKKASTKTNAGKESFAKRYAREKNKKR